MPNTRWCEWHTWVWWLLSSSDFHFLWHNEIIWSYDTLAEIAEDASYFLKNAETDKENIQGMRKFTQQNLGLQRRTNSGTVHVHMWAVPPPSSGRGRFSCAAKNTGECKSKAERRGEGLDDLQVGSSPTGPLEPAPRSAGQSPASCRPSPEASGDRDTRSLIPSAFFFWRPHRSKQRFHAQVAFSLIASHDPVIMFNPRAHGGFFCLRSWRNLHQAWKSVLHDINTLMTPTLNLPRWLRVTWENFRPLARGRVLRATEKTNPHMWYPSSRIPRACISTSGGGRRRSGGKRERARKGRRRARWGDEEWMGKGSVGRDERKQVLQGRGHCGNGLWT